MLNVTFLGSQAWGCSFASHSGMHFLPSSVPSGTPPPQVGLSIFLKTLNYLKYMPFLCSLVGSSPEACPLSVAPHQKKGGREPPGVWGHLGLPPMAVSH